LGKHTVPAVFVTWFRPSPNNRRACWQHRGRTMNGSDSIKQTAINKAKQVASTIKAGTDNGKKARKQGGLKPIITTEQQRAMLNGGSHR
jgi:hypothetical protein